MALKTDVVGEEAHLAVEVAVPEFVVTLKQVCLIFSRIRYTELISVIWNPAVENVESFRV